MGFGPFLLSSTKTKTTSKLKPLCHNFLDPRMHNIYYGHSKEPSRLKSVFILQVWYGEDVAAITQSLVEYYPYSFSFIHADNGTVPLDGYSEVPPCSTALFVPLVICFQTNCLGTTTTTAALGCIFSSCFSEFNTLPQDCWNCMLLTGLNLTEIGIR